MKEQRLSELFRRYMRDIYSDAEETELLKLWMDPTMEREKEQLLNNVYDCLPEDKDMSSEEAAAIFQLIIQKKAPVHRMFWRRAAVAASIILAIGLGSYFLFFNKSIKQNDIVKTQEERFKNDVNPGGYKAKLTLADGREIILDSAAMGELTKQGSTAVLNKDGQLIYNVQGKANEVLYNTLSTSRGEMYATVLADGSKVWLNSASTIKYPVAFVGNERKVEITGEAYFEVVKDATKPFTVSVNGMDVQVLGTHFNVNAYSDEVAIKTTLLEGSVKVTKGDKNIVIKPGEQANLKANGELAVLNNADLELVMAWKDGLFQFKRTNIETIMRDVARWYDVDVIYEGKISEKFFGSISRTEPVSKLFKLLELTDKVHFTIEGKKITVRP